MSVLKAPTEEAQLASKKAEVLRDYRTFTSSQAPLPPTGYTDRRDGSDDARHPEHKQ
jgi:hypothetical protein